MKLNKQHTVGTENRAAMQMWSIIVVVWLLNTQKTGKWHQTYPVLLMDIYIYISGQKNIVNAVRIRILHQRKENKLGSNYRRCEVVANVQSSHESLYAFVLETQFALCTCISYIYMSN